MENSMDRNLLHVSTAETRIKCSSQSNLGTLEGLTKLYMEKNPKSRYIGLAHKEENISPERQFVL